MYLIYAIFGAVFASLSTIFAKIGLKAVDSNILTSVRAVIMALVVCIFTFFFGNFSSFDLSKISNKEWLFIFLSALGGAFSWIFFFKALSSGSVISVTVIDKLSILFTAILAFVILSEKLNLQTIVGLFMVVFGVILLSLK